MSVILNSYVTRYEKNDYITNYFQMRLVKSTLS